ncbi:MAG: hypothetical protein ACRC9N_12045 [Aeromonas sp.]
MTFKQNGLFAQGEALLKNPAEHLFYYMITPCINQCPRFKAVFVNVANVLDGLNRLIGHHATLASHNKPLYVSEIFPASLLVEPTKWQGDNKKRLHDTIRHGTILPVGATNPNSTTSTSGYPQPTISGFFVPAVWATTPGKSTNELNIHADHGGSVPAFAVWLRGPNKPVRVNKARLLVEVVDAMPHLVCSMANSLNHERVLAMIYTFLINHSHACLLADLYRIRTISAFANSEAQARAALAGLPLVFMSRTHIRSEVTA